MKFRYSLIDTSYRCLEKMNLQYIQQVAVEGPGSADLHFGTTLHSVIAALMTNDEALGKVDPEALFEQQWGMLKDIPLVYSRGSWSELREMGLAFISKFQRLHLKKYEPLYIEKPIEFKLGEHEFTGTVDFIGNVEGKLSVTDWKTSGFPYAKDKIEVSPQLYLYSFAAEQIMGRPVEQIVYTVFVKNPDRRIQTIVYKLEPSKLKAMLAEVQKQCDLIVATKDYPKNLNSCMMGERKCEFWGVCHGRN